jgi:hypothetical protein
VAFNPGLRFGEGLLATSGTKAFARQEAREAAFRAMPASIALNINQSYVDPYIR